MKLRKGFQTLFTFPYSGRFFGKKKLSSVAHTKQERGIRCMQIDKKLTIGAVFSEDISCGLPVAQRAEWLRALRRKPIPCYRVCKPWTQASEAAPLYATNFPPCSDRLRQKGLFACARKPSASDLKPWPGCGFPRFRSVDVLVCPVPDGAYALWIDFAFVSNEWTSEVDIACWSASFFVTLRCNALAIQTLYQCGTHRLQKKKGKGQGLKGVLKGAARSRPHLWGHMRHSSVIPWCVPFQPRHGLKQRGQCCTRRGLKGGAHP